MRDALGEQNSQIWGHVQSRKADRRAAYRQVLTPFGEKSDGVLEFFGKPVA
jgi:hypothetical protein